MAKICICLFVFSLPGPFNATTAHCVVCEERVRCTEVTCPKEKHHCPCHTSSRCSSLLDESLAETSKQEMCGTIMDRFLAWIWPNKKAEQQKIRRF